MVPCLRLLCCLLLSKKHKLVLQVRLHEDNLTVEVEQGFKLTITSLSLSLLSFSHVCTFSRYSAEGGTGRCVMPCAAMPCPTLAWCPLPPLLRWHVEELIASGECMYVCVCLNESDSLLHLLKHAIFMAKGVCVCTWAYDSPMALDLWRW